jgi:hypothetical protein
MGATRAMTLWVLLACAATAQNSELDYRIYSEHPRIFLGPRRLRLLKREQERRSLRWVQFEALVEGGAPMPEQGFAYALYYRVSGSREAGRKAVDWALGSNTDLRQLALVFDWCQDLLEEAQSRQLAAKLVSGIERSGRDHSVPATRSRVLAAVALAAHNPELSAGEMARSVRGWWESRVVAEIKAGHDPVAREDAYALFEFLHAVRDNLNLDLRDSLPRYFKDLPIYHLLSHYPASYPASENEYRIPIGPAGRQPDLKVAALSRAAELAMVAFDANAPESQVLQGWLMHDRYLLRGTFGMPYEFLWANPYQPGLSYYHVPLVYHDRDLGRLFVRSSWDDSARWLGFSDGRLQMFEDGRVTLLNPQLTSGPLALTEAVVYFGKNARKFRALLQDHEQVFVLGLEPRRKYEIEVDDEEMREQETDRGGILALSLPHGVEVGVRLRESRQTK